MSQQFKRLEQSLCMIFHNLLRWCKFSHAGLQHCITRKFHYLLNLGTRNFTQIQKRIAEIKKMNKPVITVCKSGARSAMAKTWLANASITVYNGGSWNSLSGKI